MKIDDFYKMETINCDKEWQYSDFIQSLFDITFDYDMDIDNEKHDKLKIETKLSKNVDGERGIQYEVLTFEDVPFCLFIGSGRGWDENQKHYVTCEDTFNLARKYILSFLQEKDSSVDITSKDIEIQTIEYEYGYFVYKDGDKYKLVNSSDFVFDKEKDYLYVTYPHLKEWASLSK